MENVIEVRDVNKFFGEEHVLKDVSHTFEKVRSTASSAITVPARQS